MRIVVVAFVPAAFVVLNIWIQLPTIFMPVAPPVDVRERVVVPVELTAICAFDCGVVVPMPRAATPDDEDVAKVNTTFSWNLATPLTSSSEPTVVELVVKIGNALLYPRLYWIAGT